MLRGASLLLFWAMGRSAASSATVPVNLNHFPVVDNAIVNRIIIFFSTAIAQKYAEMAMIWGSSDVTMEISLMEMDVHLSARLK